MVLNKQQIRQLYQRTANFYDIALWGYRLMGVTGHRQRAIESLQLQLGDTVVDIGCGTGANFAMLEKAVGPTGRIIGVDLSEAMLARAAKRIERAGWKNTLLVEADLTTWTIPKDTAGVIATFALEMVPKYDAVIRRINDTLLPERRLALLGIKHQEQWPN